MSSIDGSSSVFTESAPNSSSYSSSVDGFVWVDLPLRHSRGASTSSAEEVASKNIGLLAAYPLEEWSLFAIRDNFTGHLEVVPERNLKACSSYDRVLKMVEDTFDLLRNNSKKRITSLKDRAIENIQRYIADLSHAKRGDGADLSRAERDDGADLSRAERDDVAKKFLLLIEKFEDKHE